MKYQLIKDLGDEDFRRLTGVKYITFEVMITVLIEHEAQVRKRGGHKPKLSIEDRLLMALEYWREYRTYFHIATSRNISESNCFRWIKAIENVLIRSKKIFFAW